MLWNDSMAARKARLAKIGEAKSIRNALHRWWKEHGRPFPWRESSDPYRVLVAELLLHRTQAKQVVEVYHRFVDQYPTVESLANADPASVVALTRPLGLRWRSALLVAMAQNIVEEHHGRVPSDPSALKELPGVSDYIAGAVRCFAWGHPEPILDTNIVRITGRLVGISTRDNSRRDPMFRALAAQLVDTRHPRESNWALLDLGAQVCRPAHPRCRVCPLRGFCAYGRHVLTSR